MKLWRWFVGQVARLRRSVVGVFASGWPPHRRDDRLAFADEPARPPAHWVERVRRGAPGLLEPSLRRRGGPVEPPPAERIALSQTELGPEPESLEEPEHGYVRTEPTVAPQRPEAPVRKLRTRRLRQVLRRTPRAVEVSPDTNHVPHKLETAARRVSEPPGSPPPEPDREAVAGERTRTPAPPRQPADDGSEHSQRPPVPDKPTRFQRPATRPKTMGFQAPPEPDEPERIGYTAPPEPERLPGRSEVVAFEAPVQRRRAARAEQETSAAPPLESEATRPSTRSVPQAELAVDEIVTDLFLEQADPAPSPAPIRGAERLPQRLVAPRLSPQEPSPTRRRAEPLSEAGAHPWPELPRPLDQPDDDVEAALRAWEHQRRLDLEQTRL